MGNTEDIRWIQRFSNYKKALAKLSAAIVYVNQNFFDNENSGEKENLEHILNDIVKQGLIQSFEYTHELAWNVIKDYFYYQGNTEIRGSRDAAREAFKTDLIAEGHTWMDMIESRNKTSHTYNEQTANEIFTKIIDEYYPVFVDFQDKMQKLKEKEESL